MNYATQQRYLKRSRLWAAGWIFAVATLLAVSLAVLRETRSAALGCALTVIALTASLWYSPDYLHLGVAAGKPMRWQIKIRWRLAAAVPVLAILVSRSGRVVIAAVLVGIGVAVTNLAAKRFLSSASYAVYVWTADLLLLALVATLAGGDLLLLATLLVFAAHLSLVVCERRLMGWAAAVVATGTIFLAAVAFARNSPPGAAFAAAGLLLLSVSGTAYLVCRAQRQNRNNADASLHALMAFTGESAERIRELFLTSDRQLAENWQLAGIGEDESDRMREWYRENSGLYLFGLASFGLDYKRIRSNLKVLRFARGACLDYGAGNGDLALELARRGHPATYFDVDGQTMAFARRRAQWENLAVEFVHCKEDLPQDAFDTIFSFDVLEHLPDLAKELNFLLSLLKPGGMLMFDLPAGSTKNHPMHLNHRMDVRAYLLARGLRELRSPVHRLPLVRQEKFVFVAPGGELGAEPEERTRGASGAA